MNARRILMLAAALLLTFHSTAQGQTPLPAAAPTAAPRVVAPARPGVAPATPVPTPVSPVLAPAPVATASPVATAARPAVAPVAPRATIRPELAMEPIVPLDAPDQQTPPPPPLAPSVPPQAPKVVRPAVAPVAEVVTPMPKVVREPPAPRKMIAVRVEFTITDQLGAKLPTKKSMTMTVAAGEVSRIRTNVRYARKAGSGYNFEIAPLSVDARPEVDGNKIWLDFTLEYNLLDEPTAEGVPGGSTTVSERLFAVLESGVSTVIAQSSDALSDRKITIEVKATVMK